MDKQNYNSLYTGISKKLVSFAIESIEASLIRVAPSEMDKT